MTRVKNLNQIFGLLYKIPTFWDKIDNSSPKIKLICECILAVCAVITVIKLF